MKVLICGYLFLIMLFDDVSAVVQVEVNVAEYDSKGRDADGACCKPDCSSCDEITLTICLSAPTSNDYSCEYYGPNLTDYLPEDGMAMNHSIQVTITDWQKGFRLSVNASSGNTSLRADLDTITNVISIVNMTAETEPASFTFKTLTGQRNSPYSELKIAYRAYCAPNFYGEECNTNCVEPEGGDVQYYACHPDTGEKVCLPGWETSNLDCTPDVDDCMDAECFNNGTCVDLFRDVRCQCQAGYTGAQCEIQIDECSSNPCQFGGICVDLAGDFMCFCPPGHVGKSCDFIMCEQDPCFHQGTCLLDPDDSMPTCVCPADYTGRFCEQEMCDVLQCRNGATCNATDATCMCASGFSGATCDVDICDHKVCLNSGSCVQGSCLCLEGLTGSSCEESIDECDSSPCLNEGLCIEEFIGFHCQCVSNFIGTLCEEELLSATVGQSVPQDVAVDGSETSENSSFKMLMPYWAFAIVCVVALVIFGIVTAYVVSTYKDKREKKRLEELKRNRGVFLGVQKGRRNTATGSANHRSNHNADRPLSHSVADVHALSSIEAHSREIPTDDIRGAAPAQNVEYDLWIETPDANPYDNAFTICHPGKSSSNRETSLESSSSLENGYSNPVDIPIHEYGIHSVARSNARPRIASDGSDDFEYARVVKRPTLASRHPHALDTVQEDQLCSIPNPSRGKDTILKHASTFQPAGGQTIARPDNIPLFVHTPGGSPLKGKVTRSVFTDDPVYASQFSPLSPLSPQYAELDDSGDHPVLRYTNSDPFFVFKPAESVKARATSLPSSHHDAYLDNRPPAVIPRLPPGAYRPDPLQSASASSNSLENRQFRPALPAERQIVSPNVRESSPQKPVPPYSHQSRPGSQILPERKPIVLINPSERRAVSTIPTATTKPLQFEQSPQTMPQCVNLTDVPAPPQFQSDTPPSGNIHTRTKPQRTSLEVKAVNSPGKTHLPPHQSHRPTDVGTEDKTRPDSQIEPHRSSSKRGKEVYYF